MSVRIASILLLVGLCTPSAPAQQFDRRARNEPEIVLEAGGRSGTCDVLQFTADGNYLLAAGDDKVVRVWPHGAGGLDKALDRAKTLRWRAWRDQLGGIKAIDVSPDGKRVAVGGYGLRISSVAILNRETGSTIAITWPKSGEGIPNFDAVMAIAYHPDGQRVGFGTADGTLWLWDTRQPAPVRVGRFAKNKNAQGLEEPFNPPRTIRFTDANTLVSVSERGQVVSCSLAGPFAEDLSKPLEPSATLFDVNDKAFAKFAVNEVRWLGDGSGFAANTAGPLVLLRSADGKRSIELQLPPEHFPRGLAIHPKSGKLAIGVGRALPAIPGQPRFFADGDYEIWVYDNPFAAQPGQPLKIPHSGRVEALAFHPELDRLAVAGGDADEVTLLDLSLPAKPVSVTRGHGRHITGVNLSESGDILGIQIARNATPPNPNVLGTGPWIRFDLNRCGPTGDRKARWVDPLATARGWTIVPDADSRFVWYAERALPEGGKKERLRLGLNPRLDLAPTCFTFVPTPEGRPQRVLIGHYYGCSLFELDPDRLVKNPATGNLELPRSKLFIGHGAEVNSIVADRRGNWFVTASSDQTVAAWSLDTPAFGGTFEAIDGKLVASRIDVGSPCYEAGLTKGDTITFLSVDGTRIYDRREGLSPLGTLEGALVALKQPQPGIELVFGWVSPGQKDFRVTPSRLKVRPLWKWFPAFDDRNTLTDSVIWMWYGSYYYTESTHGDRLLGWHVDDSQPNGTPTFQPLERFKHLFFNPDAIAKLIATRSIEKTLLDVQAGNPQPRSFRDVEPAPLALAVKQSTVRGDGIPVTVSVVPQGNNPDLIPTRIELWVNDYRFQQWAGNGANALSRDFLIPAAAFRAGENQISALAINPARGRAEASERVTNPVAAGLPDLHGLAVGINDYSTHRKAVNGVRAFGDLGKARADAVDLQRELLNFRGPGKCFPAGSVGLFLDARADRTSLLAELENLRDSGTKPDDLLVVFFAGHGDLLSANGREPLELSSGRGLVADSGTFVFCCPNYTPLHAKKTALSGEELFEALAKINCRKLVLLDTCHAGGAVEANVLRRFIPNGQGPFVIAACDQSEQSFEDDKLGHGVFTYAVLEAFGSKFRKATENSDGKLSGKELYDYVRERVPDLMRQVKPGNTQNPICFPQPDLLPRVVLFAK